MGALDADEFFLLEDDELSDAMCVGRYPDAPIHWVGGDTPYDLLGGSPRLVSNALVAAFTAAGLTGWTLDRPELGPTVADLEEYSLLVVTGASSPPVYAGRPIAGTAAPFYRGFDVEAWDGSDVFTPAGTDYCCLSARAAEALGSAGLTNVRVSSAASVETFLSEFEDTSSEGLPARVANEDQLFDLEMQVLRMPTEAFGRGHGRTLFVAQVGARNVEVLALDPLEDAARPRNGARGALRGLTWVRGEGLYVGVDEETLLFPLKSLALEINVADTG
jgi:hypothetical protein